VKLPREPFSWDGADDEEPISMSDLSPVTHGEPVDDDEAVLAAAESHVLSAQEALTREETDPALLLPTELERRSRSGGEGPISLLGRAVRVCLVAALCVAAFMHGWSQGSAQAAAPSCDPDHCVIDSGPEGSTKEQLP
jgi:hypothetical protein